MKHCKSVEFLSLSRMSIPLHKRKAPPLKTFSQRFCLDRSLKHLSEHSELYQAAGFVVWFKHGTELKIFALARLWQVEWTAQCSHIGRLVDHTSPARALFDIRNNAVTQMFQNEQNKLGCCHRNGMAEVAKLITMATAVH